MPDTAGPAQAHSDAARLLEAAREARDDAAPFALAAAAALVLLALVSTTPVKTSVVTGPGPYAGCALTVPARTAGKTLVLS